MVPATLTEMANFKPHATPESLSRPVPNIPVTGERLRRYLLPGDLHAAAEPCQITTILGSCVAICLWDARRRAGGMNHFLLPASRPERDPSMRFGDLATAELLERLLALGCRRQSITAKLFGGAALFQSPGRYSASLGAKNVASALLMMKNARIPVIANETGGHHGRKIVFNTDDGLAWSRRI